MMNNTQTVSRYGVVAKGASIVLSAALLASSFSFLGGTFVAPEVDAATSVNYMVADQQDGSILQCFNWSFTAIKNNMPKIAEQGFTAIQTSPIQTAKEGTAGKTAKGSWWVQYQPADFTIETNANGTGALGTATEFRAMCEEAHKYGVRVIVDAVLNHMANQTKNNLSSAIPEKYRNNSNFWHDISKNSWYESRYDITQFCMDGVPDLNTGSQDVQNAAISFMKECIDCGADGFRFDGAKHIEVPVDSGFGSQFWPNVLGATTSYAQSTRGITPYYYGEVLDKPTGDSDISNGQNVANSYSQYMSITMSGVSNSIRGSVNSGDANGAKRSDYSFDGGAGSVSGKKAVLWNESHDTYQAGHSSGVSDYKMNQTWALVGSRATSCGMYLARPSNWGSAMMGQGDVTAWANTEVKAVNDFNNYFVGQTEYLSSSGSIAYNERGTAGVVIVNVGGGATSVNIKANKMANGTYKDQVSGNTFTVSGGQISGQIGNTGIAVVYNATPIVQSAVVTATPGTSSFTDSVTVKLGVQNASSGSYSTSDGQSGTYTDGKTITFGSGVSVGGTVTLTLSATGEDGVKKTETYTYTKKDPSAITSIYFDNSTYKWSNVYAYVASTITDDPQPSPTPTPSGTLLFSDTQGWGSVNAYFFNASGAVTDAWPGTAMTSNGTNEYGQAQFKVSVPSGATSVVFNGGGAQTVDITLSGVTGYYCTGAQENGKYVVGSWTSSSASSVTCNAAWPGVKMTLDSTTGYYRYDVPDNLVNGYVIFSDGAEDTTNRYPARNGGGLAIGSATKLLSGTSWTAYTPAPPTKDPTVKCNKASGTSFTSETFDITLSLENASSGTYSVDGGPTKSFTSSKTVTIGEGKIGDSTVTVATTAKGSDGTTKSYTFTFEKKYVVKTTSSSAASANSKYATNPGGNVGANKTITSASDFTAETLIAQGVANDDPAAFRGPHEAPKFDLYALYAAWDSTNLYVGIQYTNVIDVVAPEQEAPQMGRGKPNGADADIPQMLLFDLGTGNYTDGSTNSTAQPTVWNTNITFGGSTQVDKILMYSPKEGIDNYSVFPVTNGVIDYTNAVSPGYQKPLAGASITWEDGFFGSAMYGINSVGYKGYTPADLESSSGDWVDFLTTGHSKTQDTFCIITLPLSYLGVSASDIANNGIGLMAVSTYGSSGMGCLPHDTCMLDNATEPYEKDDSTSGEKSDADQITVPLARVGKGGNTPVPPSPTTPLQANFGTDKSAPQLTTTALTLKAIGMGGTAPYTYTFKVDGTTVKANNSTATYTWTPGTAGQHTITCIIKDSTGKTSTTEKTFTAEGSSVDVPATGITLSRSTANLLVGRSCTATATVLPENATNKTVTWTTSNSSVATVSNGTITAKAVGTATITAKTHNGKTATVAVTVKSDSTVAVTGITLSRSTANLLVGHSCTATATITPSNATDQTVTWTSSNTSVATVSAGKITGKAVGTATITAKTNNGKTATVKVTVKSDSTTVAVTGITLSRSTANLLVGHSCTATATITPSNATNQTVTWTSSNTSVATVSAGKITGKAVGTATITAKTNNGKTATVKVTVKSDSTTVAVTGITLSRSTANLLVGHSCTATATITPDNATNKTVTWTTSNSSVATVSAGKITGKAVGTATITAKTNNGKTATVKVTVKADSTTVAVTGITLSRSTANLLVGHSCTATATITPDNATNKTVTWTTSNSSVATVSAGKITAKGVGTCTITAKTNNGKTATVKVTVKADTSTALTNSSKLSKNSITLGTTVTLTGVASGGTSPYKYAFYYKPTTSSTYITLGTEFSSTSSTTFKPTSKGYYDIMISVKDSTGKRVDQTFALSVS